MKRCKVDPHEFLEFLLLDELLSRTPEKFGPALTARLRESVRGFMRANAEEVAMLLERQKVQRWPPPAEVLSPRLVQQLGLPPHLPALYATPARNNAVRLRDVASKPGLSEGDPG